MMDETLIADLVMSGLDPDLIGRVANAIASAAAGSEMRSSGPSKAALRTRQWRERRASQNVTERHAVAPHQTVTKPSQNVTERHSDVTGEVALLLTSNTRLENKEQEKKVRGPNRARPSPMPDGWIVPDRAKPIAAELGVDLKQVEERFRDYLASSGKLYADYDAGFCNFVRNTPRFSGGPNGGTSGRNGNKVSPITAALNKHLANFERQTSDSDEVHDVAPRLLSNG